jgi:hypothetical protein
LRAIGVSKNCGGWSSTRACRGPHDGAPAPNLDDKGYGRARRPVLAAAYADLRGRLLSGIDADCNRRPADRIITVFVGDNIDRGPASRQAFDLLLQWRQDREAVFLKGNHETFLPRFLADTRTLDNWRLCGGLETLLSYGLKPQSTPAATNRSGWPTSWPKPFLRTISINGLSP